MKASLRKMGNSHGVIIPKALITQLGFDKEVEMRVVDGGILLERADRHPRDGWDETCRGLSEEAPDHEWLDVGNAGDETLKW